MKLCPICWKNGRSLDVSDCLCSPTTTVLTTSQFFKAMGKEWVPPPKRDLDAPKREETVFKPRPPVFGEAIQKQKKKK